MDREKLEESIELIRESVAKHFEALATLYQLDIQLSHKLLGPSTVDEVDEMYCDINSVYKTHYLNLSASYKKPNPWISLRKSKQVQRRKI